MDLGVGRSRLRCATIWVLATGAALALVRLLLPVLAQATTAARTGGFAEAGFEPLLVWGCATVAAVATCWLWLVTTLVTFDAARGRHTVRRGVPLVVRSALFGLCGVALTTGLTGPATASGDAPPAPPPLTGLRLPERIGVHPSAGAAPVKAPMEAAVEVPVEAPVGAPGEAPASISDTVVVSRGDTLWAITAEWLGPGASDQDVASAWPAVFALNRDVIGHDPGLIEPGQRLLLPPTTGGTDR
jgi:hypothetical protein